MTSDFGSEVEKRPFRAYTMKKCNITFIYGRIAEISASLRKSGLRNTMLTSAFRPKVQEIQQFCTCNRKYAI